jgi:hypothetical protein
VSPYDPDTMGCRGLQRYMNEILPSTEWTNEAMRPALAAILRRLDKTFNKIYKKPSIRVILLIAYKRRNLLDVKVTPVAYISNSEHC